MTPISPPMAGSMLKNRWPVAIPTAIGTQIASTARTMSGHGGGAGFGRTTSASHSGTIASRSLPARQVTALFLPLPPADSDECGTVHARARSLSHPSGSPRRRVRDDTGMETSRLLDCLAVDYAALSTAATAAGMDAPVPSCPGWEVADLVTHVAEVYLHKTAAMRLNTWPDPWPPAGLEDEPQLELLARAYGELTTEFAARSADSAAKTWHEPDQTVGFWIRRMAQETVIHRIDAELAAGGRVTPVPDDLAIDGVDEVLKLFLGYGSVAWPEEYAELKDGHPETADGTESIVVEAGPVSWTVRPSPSGVTVTDGADTSARAIVTSVSSEKMLLWLWGRGDDVTVGGDEVWGDYLRRLLAAVTV
jgi:uncharacterized protein (TIGR03083 family)